MFDECTTWPAKRGTERAKKRDESIQRWRTRCFIEWLLHNVHWIAIAFRVSGTQRYRKSHTSNSQSGGRTWIRLLHTHKHTHSFAFRHGKCLRSKINSTPNYRSWLIILAVNGCTSVCVCVFLCVLEGIRGHVQVCVHHETKQEGTKAIKEKGSEMGLRSGEQRKEKCTKKLAETHSHTKTRTAK